MYRSLGQFGSVNIRGISYMEDRMMDMTSGYRLGFDLVIFPELMVSNNCRRVLIGLKWLSWEFLWWRMKDRRYYYDIQGRMVCEYHGVRYFLSLKWLLKKHNCKIELNWIRKLIKYLWIQKIISIFAT